MGPFLAFAEASGLGLAPHQSEPARADLQRSTNPLSNPVYFQVVFPSNHG